MTWYVYEHAHVCMLMCSYAVRMGNTGKGNLMGRIIIYFQFFIILIPHILEAFSLYVVILLVDKVSDSSLLPHVSLKFFFQTSPGFITSVQM